jgi:putative ABC transport system permease protein
MRELLNDLTYALRVHRKAAGFSVVATLTVALGIGASATVFSAVNAILLAPLPYPQPDRIVSLLRVAPPGIGYTEFPSGRVDSLFYMQESKSFDAVGAFKGGFFNLTGTGAPERVDGVRVSAGFFQALGVDAHLGRTFTAADDQAGHEHVVVLGDRLWREELGADPAVIGQTLRLNGIGYVVIGVMPPGFDFPRASGMPAVLTLPRAAQLWVPLALVPGPAIRGEESDLALVARLKARVSVSQAQAEMDLLKARLEALYPTGRGWFGARVITLGRELTVDSRRPLWFTLGAVATLLLIACTNLASLLITRSLARQREFAVRAALGASRARLLRQLLTEYLLLAVAGGGLGIGLAWEGVRLLARLGPSDVPRLSEAALDPTVIAFAIGVTLVTGLLFGLAPAWTAARGSALDAVTRAGRRVVGATGALTLRQGLLVAEIGLAVVLVTASGLLARTFAHLIDADPGFTADHVLTFELTLSNEEYGDQPHVVALYQNVLQHLRAVPGVESAAIVETLPMSGAPESTGVRIPGRPTDPARPLYANYTIVSPGYFASVGTRILRGRDILESDSATSQPVTVINQAMAEAYWPGADPIGRQVTPPIFKDAATIVGIVPDEKHVSLGEKPAPEMWVPFTQKVWPSMQTMDVVVRTSQDAASMTSAARDAMRAAAPDVPMARVATLEAVVGESLQARRFSVVVIAAFALLALSLASIGLFGVISHSVAERAGEIGVRMALGAGQREVVAMVVGQSLRLTGVGIGMGLLAAAALTRLIESFLYGVRPLDPATFAAVAAIFVAVALGACILPARRAARIDAWRALASD